MTRLDCKLDDAVEFIDLFALGEPFEKRMSELVGSSDWVTAFRARLLVELVGLLRASGSQPRIYATLHGDEIWLSGKRRWAKVKIDWFDRAPLVNGMPNAHYRIEIHADRKLLREERAATKEEAALLLCQCLPV